MTEPILMQIGTSGPRVRTWNGQLWGQEVKGQGHTRQKCVTTYSTEGVEKDASARPPYLTSTSCDLNLWRPDPQNLTVSSPCTPSKSRQLAAKSVHSFSNVVFRRLITNVRTDGWKNDQLENITPQRSLDWQRRQNPFRRDISRSRLSDKF